MPTARYWARASGSSCSSALEDAVRDGDRIYAVIRGVGRRQRRARDERDGPARRGRGAGAASGLRARPASPRTSVGLVEAHGTGTPVGDVTEIEALTQVFGERDGGCRALRAGDGQVDDQPHDSGRRRGRPDQDALALHHRVLPPTLNCEQPNPELGLGAHAVLHQHRDAPVDPRRRRAAACRHQRVRLRRHQRPRGARGARRRASARERHLPPWDSEVCILEADSPAGDSPRPPRSWRWRSRDGPEPALADLAFTLGRTSSGGARTRSGWRSWPPRPRTSTRSWARRSSG